MVRRAWLNSVRRWLHLLPILPAKRRPFPRPRARGSAGRPSSLVLESLEERLAPAGTFKATLLADTNFGDSTTKSGTLVWCITQANNAGGGTIVLNKGATYDLTIVDNTWYGPNGLPAITSPITIEGNGATIQRDPTALLRFFYVSGGPGVAGGLSGGVGSLTLENLTLAGGRQEGGNSNLGGGGLGAGGAIFNQGTLILNGDTLEQNSVLGGSSGRTTFGNGGGG